MGEFLTYTFGPSQLVHATGLVLAAIILVYGLRIPFKRQYHWLYLGFVGGFGLYFASQVIAQSSDSPETYLARVWWSFLIAGLPLTLVYHFTLSFASSKMKTWQKYSLVGSYAYSFIRIGMLSLDPTLIYTTPRQTQIGWSTRPGSMDPYFFPFGIYPLPTTFLILALLILSIHYRSQKLPLIKGQVRYLMVGIFLVTMAYFSFAWTRLFSLTIPTLAFWLSGGMAVLLLGLRKHGFFAITPVAEIGSKIPLRYNLSQGSAYLAIEPEPKQSFEVFSNLALNGHNGLCITRTPPSEFREIYGLKTTPILWLTEENSDDAVAPSDLHGLLVTVKAFIQRAERPVVILQGIGYLASINGFRPVLKLIARLSDVNIQRNGIMVFSAIPGILTVRQIVMLRDECPSLQRLEVSQSGEATISPLQPVEEIHPLLMKNASVPAEAHVQEPLQFKLDDAQKVFRFLAKAFLQDYTVQKIFIDNAGWRSLSEIAVGATLPISKMYGRRGGEPGSALAELIKRGLAETKWLSGQRGRGGETMKVRINYGNPYVKAEVDRFALQP